MIITTTQVIKLRLLSVPETELEFVSSFMEVRTGTGGSYSGQSFGTTAVILVPRATSNERQVTAIQIYNKNSASATVLIELFETVTRTIFQAVLDSGDVVYYSPSGWQVLDNTGAIKTV